VVCGFTGDLSVTKSPPETPYTLQGRHVYKPADPRLPGKFRQAHRPLVIDFRGDVWSKLAGRIVGKLGHVDDSVHLVEVSRLGLTNIFSEC
jgi:hypothetical protein